MPWEQIKAADYSPAGDLKTRIATLRARHTVRVKNDIDFIALQQEIAEQKRRSEQPQVSLNEAERRREQKVARKSGVKVEEDGLQANERKLTSELAAEEARKGSKDVLLAEAVNVLGDEVELLKQEGGAGQLSALTHGNAYPRP